MSHNLLTQDLLDDYRHACREQSTLFHTAEMARCQKELDFDLQ